MAIVIVKDESLLLCYLSVFIKLWELYVARWAMTWPDEVLMFLPLERSFRMTPFGRLDFLMRQQEAPESKRIWNNRLLCIVPTVLTAQIVAGVSFMEMILGP